MCKTWLPNPSFVYLWYKWGASPKSKTMTMDQRESEVMELISAYANGIITDSECVEMGDLILNEISIIGGVGKFDEAFNIEGK